MKYIVIVTWETSKAIIGFTNLSKEEWLEKANQKYNYKADDVKLVEIENLPEAAGALFLDMSSRSNILDWL